MNARRSSLLAFGLSLLLTSITAGAVDTDPRHTLAVPGDFNADGRLDALYQPLKPGSRGAIVLQDGTGHLTVVAQDWDPGFLGLDWSTGASTLTAADLNGDGQDDVLVQPVKTGGTAAVIITDPTVQLLQISQLLPAGYLGLDWSSATHTVVPGDFDGDRHKELLLQAAKRGGTGAMLHADVNGQLVAVIQQFADGFLGRHWSAQDETLYVGDFNGDGRQDLLVQSHMEGQGESYYALLLADGDGRFTHIAETWNMKDLGADWNPATHKIVIEDANHDGIMDITLRSTNGGTNYLFEGNAQGLITQPSAHWTGSKSGSDTLNKGTGTKSGTNTGISVTISPSGPTAKTITPPSNPEQNQTTTRSGQGIGGSGTIMTANAAGSMKGSASASGGTGTYSIPIAVPPGIAGMQPSISLNYSSRGGNGEMGMGWSLSAGSQIHRCPATKAMDHYSEGVTYSAADRLCLDGQHLVVPSGTTYGVAGDIYHTELDGMSVVKQYGALTGTSSYFTVTRKDGHVLTYGNTADSELVASGQTAPLAWGLSTEADTYSNTITYQYSTYGAGEHLLSKILYTGSGTTAGGHEVDFNYGTRVDPSSQYLAGGLTMQTQLLSSVVTKMGGVGANVVTTYSMDYQVSAATGRTLLAGVQECGGSGTSQLCLPETTFSWHAPALSFNAPVQYDVGQLDDNGPDYSDDGYNQSSLSSPGDFDGDGRKELFYSRPGVDNKLLFLDAVGGVTNTFDLATLPHSAAYYFSSYADLNFDGGMDVVVGAKDSSGNWWVAYNLFTGTSASPSFGPQVMTTIPYSYQSDAFGAPMSDIIAVADMNGDGKPDLLISQPNGASNYYIEYYHNTTPDGAPTPTFDAPQIVYSGSNTDGYSFTLAGDMDGNGLPDIQVNAAAQVVGWIFTTRNPTNPTNGLVFSSIQSYASLGVYGDAVYVGNPSTQMDINGDGLPDYVFHCRADGNWCYQLNTGAIGSGMFTAMVDTGVPDSRTYNQPFAQNRLSGSFQADLDNDGHQEILYPDVLKDEFCVGEKVKEEGELTGAVVCATHGDYGLTLPVNEDLSIYQYSRIDFVPQTNGSFIPVASSTNLVAQSHQAEAIDLQGDGLTGIISPFSRWYDDAMFEPVGSYIKPTDISVAYNASTTAGGTGKSDNAAPDLMIGAEDGNSFSTSWDYYPLSSNKTFGSPAVPLYSVPSLTSSNRDAGEGYFYFASSMYVVGTFTQDSGAGTSDVHNFHYGQAIYNGEGRGFQGFRTVVEDDMTTGSRTVQIYHQRFPLSGSLKETWTTDQSNTLNLITPTKDVDAIDDVVDSWGCMQGTGTAVVITDPDDPTNPVTCSTNLFSGVATYTSVLVHSVETHFDLNSHTLISQVDTQYCNVSGLACSGSGTGSPSTYGYDAYGNSLGTATTVTDAYGTYNTGVSDQFDYSVVGTLTSPGWLDKLSNKTTATQANYTAGAAAMVTHAASYDTYDSGRSPTQVTETASEAGYPSITHVTSSAYSSVGNLTDVTVASSPGAPDGRHTHTAYTTDNYFVASVTDPMGLTTTTPGVDPRFGTPLTVTDPNGVTVTNAYDNLGRKTSSQVSVTGQPTLPAQTTSYITHTSGDGMCDNTTAFSAYYVLVQQAGAPDHYTCFDALNRSIRVATESFATGGDLIFQSSDYDARGRAYRTTEPHFSTAAVVWNTNTYYTDILGRLETKTDAKGVVSSYAYNLDTTTVTQGSQSYQHTGTRIITTTPTDTLNPTYSREDDEVTNSLGKMLSITNAATTSVQTITGYAYDSAGNPLTITAADGSVITAAYDALSHKTQVADPDQGTTTYTYDIFGGLLTQLDARGHTETMTYDKDGRMTGKSYATGSDPAEPSEAWTYDSCTNGLGKLCVVTQGAGPDYQESYSYDSYGRVTQDEQVFGGGTYDTNTSYDADGRVDTVTYPDSISDAIPVAVAGATQYVAPGSAVTLNGSASSDADAAPNPLSYQWTQTAGPSVTLGAATTANPTFTASSTAGTSYTFQLTVDDGLTDNTNTDTNTVTVNVPALPAAPGGLTDTGDTNHDGTYTVSWSAVSVPGTTMSYSLEEATGTSSGATGTWTEIYAGTALSTSVSHPGNGAYYYWYRVRAEAKISGSSLGYSGYSSQDSIHCVVTPGTPASITPTLATSTTGIFTINWGLYSGSLPASKVFYELDEGFTSTFSSDLIIYSGTARSQSINTHSLGDFYFRVHACNQDGTLKECSDWELKAHEIVTGTGGGQQQVIRAPSGGTITPPSSGTGTGLGMVMPALLPITDGGLKPMLAIREPNSISRHSGEGQNPALNWLASTKASASNNRASVRPKFAPPVYQAWAGAHLQQATGTTMTVRLSVKNVYTAHGYLWKLVSGANPNHVYWQVDNSQSGTDATGNVFESGMDTYGRVTDSIAGGSVTTHNGYDGTNQYLDTIHTSNGVGGSTVYQDLHYQWYAIGTLQSRSAYVTSGGTTYNPSETFIYDVHNRLNSSTVTNGSGTQPAVTYSYDSVGDITSRSDVGTYAYGGPHPHAVTSVSGTTTSSYAYDADGNMFCRDAQASSCSGSGPTPDVSWNSDNLATSISDGTNTNSFAYAPDKHRYKQIAVTPSGTDTTLYIGGLEILTSGGTTTYKYTLEAYGRPVLLDELKSTGTTPGETKSALLTDHLGSIDTVMDVSTTTPQHQSFNTFGRHRDPTTWATMAANTQTLKKRGYTDHEHLDALGLVDANGRMLDPVVGRFLSVDPMYQSPTNSQSINPYSYVMNNPLSLVDPSGYAAACTPDSSGSTTSCTATISDMKPGDSKTATVTTTSSSTGSHIDSHSTVTGTVTMNKDGSVSVKVDSPNGSTNGSTGTNTPSISNAGGSGNQGSPSQRQSGLSVTWSDGCSANQHTFNMPDSPPPGSTSVWEQGWSDVVTLDGSYKPHGGPNSITQMAGIVYHETRNMDDGGLENRSLDAGKGNIAHVRLNGIAKWGSNVDKHARMASSLADDGSDEYANDYMITIRAVAEDLHGVDPTHGSIFYNMRTDNQDFAGRPYNGQPVRTQSGPYDSPSKYDYIETYGPKPPP
jgi:RHS repeat-associated protein